MLDFVYGYHAVEAVLQHAESRAKCLWVVAKSDRRLEMIMSQASKKSIPSKKVSREEIEDKFSDLGLYQGVVLEVKPTSVYGEGELEGLVSAAIELKGRVTVLALDEVQDPRNLGACLRSAAAYGVDVVVIPKRRAATLTPAAEKVACGGAVFVPVVAVTNLVRSLKALQAQGLWVVGTSLDTKHELSDIDLTGKVVIVMGGEAEGIRQLTEKTCDYLAKIPMSGVLPSLNVSAATTVCLYEQFQQQKKKK
jgi:23S rRNA (guanosine2251-2'-O)-methyltransferase